MLLGLALLPAGAQNGKELAFQKWALTPPMGWNSWDCYGPTVVESEVKANADYMAEKLAAYGWEYVVVDIRWFVENDKAGGYNQTNPIYVYDEYGRYTPALNRFPSAANGVGFKALADYVHGKGLKFGIHLMRGLPKIAAEKKLPVKGTNGITCDMIASNDSACTWLRDNYKVDYRKEGAQEYYNSCFELYAQWGVDFVKIDDLSRPYHTAEIEMIRKAIDKCGRPIVLSISPGETPLDRVEHVKGHANMWRTVDDFWDNWSQLNYQFGVCAKWAPYIAPGTWPDADMLPLGKISIRGERGSERWTNFTRDEQYTMMNLWTIFKSPLMFGGDLPQNDAATDSLLTNRDVIYMHNYSAANRQLSNIDNKVVWAADDPANGDKFVALFNLGGSDFVNTKDVMWRSGTISYLTTGYGTAVEAQIPEGSRELALIVTDGGDGYDCDHADWIDPVVTTADGKQYDLTEMKYLRGTCGWGNIAVDKNINGGTLSINGQQYQNGIAVHANSILLYKLPEGAVKFTAYAGLDNTGTDQGSKSSVEFMVCNYDPTIRTETTDQWNGGNKTIKVDPSRQAATSGFIGKDAGVKSAQIEADITGAEKLYLVVTDGGDGLSYDHADWANPVLIDKDGNEHSLTEIAWDANPINGWNAPKLNKNNDGNTMTINGVAYDKGFGVNAPSMLTFTLPEGHQYVAFRSTVGYDDDVNNAPQGVTMEFRVFTQNPEPDNTAAVALDLVALGFAKDQECKIVEMWKGTEMGVFKNSEFAPVLRSHASGLYRVSAVKRTPGASVSMSVPSGKLTAAPFDISVSVSGGEAEGAYIQLLCDGKVMGTMPVGTDGTAVYTCSGLYAGEYELQALYSGTTNVAPAASTPMTISVEGEKEDLSLLKASLQTLIEEAEQIDASVVAGALREPLAAAISVAKSVKGETKAELENAIAELRKIVEEARLSISSMNALQAEINNAKTFLDAIREGEEKTKLAEGIAQAQSTYESSTSTVENIKDAATALSQLLLEIKKTAQPKEGTCFDMTEYLVNPSFENKTTGWSVSKVVSGWESFDTWSDRPAADGIFFVSLCYQNITSIDLYQEVKGLPAGNYSVSAALRNTDGPSFVTDQHIYASVNGKEYKSDALKEVSGDGNNNWYYFEITDVELAKDGVLRLGAKSSGTGSGTNGWFQADKFQLFYWGEKVADGISELKSDRAVGVFPTNGGVNVVADKALVLTVYHINGVVARQIDVHTGSNFIALPKGCYIIEGKVVGI